MLKKINNPDVFREQLRVLYQNAPLTVTMLPIAAAIIAYAIWEEVNQSLLLAWLMSIALLSIIRFIDRFIFWKTDIDEKGLVIRANIVICFTAISGILWGLGGFFFTGEDNFLSTLLIVMTLPAIVASTTVSLSVFQPAYIAFAVPTISLLSLKLFILDDRIYTVAGILVLIFLFVNMFFSKSINKLIINSIKLQFKNVELIEKYKQEKTGAEDAREKAEHANIAKSKFLAAASHDLRQPLHALMLNATVLSERNNHGNDVPVINNIINSVRSLESLFNSLLDISKLDAGIVTPNKIHFRLQTVFDRLKVDCQSLSDEKELILDMPDTDLYLYTDPVLLERILRNLISNGIRYTESGCVGLVVEQNSGTVNLRVVDTGIGINKENLGYIFEEFVQLSNPERDRGKGLGLGLSIVKRLCNLLGCSVQVESSTDKGSMFYFSVPLGDAELVSEQLSSNTEYSPKPINHFVVIVDDEKSIRDGLQSLLESWNCTILAFGSEEEAIDKLKEYEYAPDVLLVDYRLRENKTGIEAITAINNLFGEKIPALIITGDTASERLQEAERSGYQLLHKPLQPSQLRVFLQKI